MLKTPLKFIITIVLTLGLSMSFQSLLASWTAPTVNPPGDNVAEPINSGSDHQSKSGLLSLTNGLSVFGTTILNGNLSVTSGNVGIGTLNPVAKLSIGFDGAPGTGISVGPRNQASTPDFGVWAYGKFQAINGTSDHANGIGVVGIASGAGGKGVWGSASDSTSGWAGYFDGRGYFSGNVGIGTTAPSPGLKLDVEGKVGATEYCDQDGNGCKTVASMGGGINFGDLVMPSSTTCVGCSDQAIGLLPRDITVYQGKIAVRYDVEQLCGSFITYTRYFLGGSSWSSCILSGGY